MSVEQINIKEELTLDLKELNPEVALSNKLQIDTSFIKEEKEFLDECVDRVGVFCNDHKLAASMFFEKTLLPKLDS